MGLSMGAETAGPPLNERQRELMRRIVDRVPLLLTEAYGGALLAVVLFGSVARGTAHPHSDSDWLVVLRRRASQPREDHRGCERVRKELAPLLARAAVAALQTEPQFHLRSAAEAEQGGPLFLDLCHDGIACYDPEGWAASFMARYRRRLAAQGSVRVPLGDSWYWRLTPAVRPADEVWF